MQTKEKRNEYREAHKEETAAYNAGHRRVRQRWFTDTLNIWKRAQGCDDCDTHEGRLGYHHLDPVTKLYQISEMCNHSLETLMDEIRKCTVLCQPCHLGRRPR